jgi:periplasmic protein TonB
MFLRLSVSLTLLAVSAFSAFAAPVIRVDEVAARRAAIEMAQPEYPPTARQLKIAGRVVVEATITEAGTVSEAHAVTGNAVLTRSAVDAIRRWKFKPFLADGQPASASVLFSFEFAAH